MSGIWTPEPYEAGDGAIPFERFVNGLSDFKFMTLDAALDRVLSVRGIDLVRTEWLKALGEGLHEFRVRHDADEVANMFGGGPPQVAEARRLLAQFKERRRRQRGQASPPKKGERRG